MKNMSKFDKWLLGKNKIRIKIILIFISCALIFYYIQNINNFRCCVLDHNLFITDIKNKIWIEYFKHFKDIEHEDNYETDF